MIRRLLAIVLMAPLFALAAPVVAVQLENVRLIELVRIVYGDMLHKDYIIDTDALALQDAVTLDLRNVKPEKIASMLSDLLESRGMAIKQTASAAIVHKKSDLQDRETLVYHPKNRSVPYLLDLVSTLFPHGSFSGRQAQSMPVPVVQQLPQSTQQQALPVQMVQQPQQMPLLPQQPQNNQVRDVLIYSGTPESIAKLEKVLSRLDVPSGEVMVKAVVYEIQRNKLDQSAVDLVMSVLSSRLGVTFQSSGAGQGVVKLAAGGISAAFSALSTDSRFKVVTAPSLRVQDGIEASFSVGSDVPVLGQVTYQTNGQPVQSVEYKPSGVLFRVTPSIRTEGVSIKLFQQLSNFVSTTNGVNNSPTLTKRELKTDVQVQTDELLILGGLEENKTQDDSSAFTLLPFLTSANKTHNNTEIILMLQVTRI